MTWGEWVPVEPSPVGGGGQAEWVPKGTEFTKLYIHEKMSVSNLKVRKNAPKTKKKLVKNATYLGKHRGKIVPKSKTWAEKN